MNGAFRFNTRAARRFASAGFPCVCADTHGVGRSGGVMENQEQRVLFRRICDGLFASDVHDASVLLKEKAGVSKVALFGVCGGAITNILAHARFADVDESVLLSVPVMLPSLDYNEVRMTEGYARFFLGMYVSKIFNPRAWWRFITFQSENRVIMKSLWVAATGRIARLLGRRKKAAGPSAPVRERQSGLETAVPGIGDDLQFNPAFLDAFRTITGSGRRIYFIFGEHDNFKWEFESEFLEGCRADVERAGDLIKIDEITHANHMYTLREWQDLIIDRCIGWAGET
jgi:pimeloyl-ACP methyl ester carboxylesterase